VGGDLGSLAMRSIYFTSVLKKEYRNDIEQLLFLNPNQEKALPSILRSIKRYGQPKIVEKDSLLRIAIGNCIDAQDLYAFEQHLMFPRLVGCVIYLRDRPDNLSIVHLAVAPDYLMSGSSNEIPLVAQLVQKVTAVAMQIKGISTITFVYTRGGKNKLRVINTA
jgi:hypothetical protein